MKKDAGDLFKEEVEVELTKLAEQLNGNSITQAQFDVALKDIMSKAERRARIRISQSRLKSRKSILIFGAFALFTNCAVIIQQLAMNSKYWFIYVAIQLVLFLLNFRSFKKYTTEYKEAQVELAKTYLA